MTIRSVPETTAATPDTGSISGGPPADDAAGPAQSPSPTLPQLGEEVSNSIQKDGISFIFESRSLSAVIRFVYTPIEGNFSDIEVEINNAEAINFAENGGVSIEMGGRIWSAADEEVERHFVSCEQIGESVEARWQWKHGEELADFLYRISLRGKTLIVELEGGNGKAAGVDLGYVSGAVHPRVVQVPYFCLGDDSPQILATSGVFVSSYLDWLDSSASEFYAPLADDSAHEIRLGGGCRYHPASNKRRHLLRERWLLTASRQFEEVIAPLPTVSPTGSGTSLPENADLDGSLRDLLWYQISALAATEEAYVEVYEQLRSFKEWGLDDLLVVHPTDVWEEAGGRTSLSATGSESKGGDDALAEYLEAVQDLGYDCTLPVAYTDISPEDTCWDPRLVALGPDGEHLASGQGRFVLKSSLAEETANEHLPGLLERFELAGVLLQGHAESAPSARVDYDGAVTEMGRFAGTLRQQRELLTTVRSLAAKASRIAVANGGNHWMFSGLMAAFLAPLKGPTPSRGPLLVDYDLRNMHSAHIAAGVGSTSEFFGTDMPAVGELTSRSPWLDRYIAATLAFGHAGVLPEIDTWGMPAAAKTYYLLKRIQTLYLGQAVESILYHRDGSLLETTEAVVAGVHEDSQLQITYANELRLCVNGSSTREWKIEHEGTSYLLPPASFVAHGPDGTLVYSADTGAGRVDFAECADYFYCDTRGAQMNLGPLTLTGAAMVKGQDWQIDVYPIDCEGEISLEPSKFWPDRKVPRLRILAFHEGEDDPQVLVANVSTETVSLEPLEGICKFRITLPEWMVEPGQ